MIQLKTRWTDQVHAENVLPDYPRPSLVRDSYFNLNGQWDYAINQSETVSQYDGKILVPFSPETLLSGVQKIVQPEDTLHYRKVFQLPQGFIKDRVLLHFGAVDQECQVFLNGKFLGSHIGGYTAFSFDVTDVLVQGDNVLTLTVKDYTETKPHGRGKQKLVRKGKFASLFYTPQSGIWKTVWMESVPEAYVQGVQITPLFDEAAIRLNISAQVQVQEAQVEILDGDRVVKAAKVKTNEDMVLELGTFKAWSPDHPHLYDLKITLGQDQAMAYFGMRKYSVDRDSSGLLRFFFNNEPVIFNGPLDQGYWPDSLMTPPTDEALVYDILKLKELGFNTIRKHIKIEPERFYYHCDKIGMFVWQDMPNGGGEDYNMRFVTYLPNASNWACRNISDHYYNLFRREDAQGRAQYYEDLKAMVQELYNHPSIAVWVPFNEGWGQFDARKATALVESIDSTRLINEACGWFDQGGGHMYSIHNYSPGLDIEPQEDRVVALTEFGGYAYAMPGHLACEKEFGYQSYGSREELTQNYRRLWETEIYPNLEKGLGAVIYTQTSDIEEEINGVFTYDRDKVKLIESEVLEINQELYRRFDALVSKK